ncbi:MAG: AAA family ATPase [Lentisphaeria bacterium]|nr:AAA family ATPase [Lentisphaeria bacterium]
MQLLVTMEKMLCAKPDSHWYFFRATTSETETSVICKGSMHWTPGEMETLSLMGEYVVYKGERQFQFRSARLTLPLDPRSQLHYVCQRAKGIGVSLEQQIWDAKKENFRELTFGEIKKMPRSAFDSFQEQLNGFSRNSEKAEIIAWLENHGCSEGMAESAYAEWGSDASGIVNADCFRLAQLPGYSFKTVDENIRRYFDIADDDPRRIKSAVLYALEQETADGSTAINCWRHFSACQKLLPGIGDASIVEHVRAMKSEGNVYVFLEQNMMALKKDYLNEQLIYDFVLSSIPGSPSPSNGAPAEASAFHLSSLISHLSFTPDASQLAAVEHAVSRTFSVINGGAGVGKTTVIQLIVEGIKMNFPDLSRKLCAPTGKAAARLKEASGIEATTIHVMLGAMGNDIFTAGPLDNVAVIVDESSMVDSALLAEIIKRKPAKLVLVGDQAQLTPVGHGQPFHDIITLFPETVRTLTKCYRNTEAVFQAATLIREGSIPPRHAESENERWTLVPASGPSDAQEIICAWAKDGLLDFDTDIVLCPKNGQRNEDDSYQESTVNALNEALLSIDRTARGEDGLEKFLPGDRLINTVNDAEHHVWNGTTGTVHAANEEELYLKLDVPFKNEYGEPEDKVKFTREMKKALRYAYALTVHKSQGSQYRKVVLVCLPRDRFQLERSLIYTGVTRTKKECIVIGDYNTFCAAIQTTKAKDTVMQCISLEESK